MAAPWLTSGAFAALLLLLVSAANAAFNPASKSFSYAVALDRTLVNIPHQLLCRELCLKDASCASFQYNETSRQCKVSITQDDLEDSPDDEVDDSLNDLPLSDLLPTTSHPRSDCYSEPDACTNGHTCQETCSYDGAMTCSCRSSTWDREGCKPVDVGTWGEWDNWGDCSVTCGGGIQTRMRPCDDQYGGESCVGRNRETRTCGETPCPVWSEWGVWTRCTKCGRSRTRSRTCSQPGKCHGSPVDKSSCMGSKECATLIRLQRGLFVTDGWVEVWDQLKGYWRPLCGEWNRENGKVACRHVGFKDAEGETSMDIMNLGCFNDDPGERSPAEAWNATLNAPNTTSSSPQDCLAFCRLRGYIYAAIRSGEICQCGKKYARNEEELPSNCNWPCGAGDTSLTCGSRVNDKLNSVFTYAPLGSIMYFPMDEKRADSDEIVGKPSLYGHGGAGLIAGVVGQALYLNGDNQWAKTQPLWGSCLGSTVECPEGFSLGMWIKLMEVPEEDRYYMSTGGHTRSSYGFNFYYDLDYGPGFWVTHSEAWCKMHFAMPIGVWIHLILSWKAPCDVDIYINSTKIADPKMAYQTPSQLDADPFTALAIGAPNNKNTVNGVSGHAVVDELRFWDRKLTGKEIHQVMVHDLRMSGTHYYPVPGSTLMKGRFLCTGSEPLLGMCDFEEDLSLADDICGTSTMSFVRCVPNSWWGGWSAWGECENGRKRRTRKCYTPSPHYEGDCRDSPGPGVQVKPCVVND